MKKPIYCNCGTYLGEREEFDIIRCKKCGIDYIVNPKDFESFINTVKNGEIVISVTSGEEFDTIVNFLELITGEDYYINYTDITGDDIFDVTHSSKLYLFIYNEEWKFTSHLQVLNNVKIVPYQSVESIIKKELDR